MNLKCFEFLEEFFVEISFKCPNLNLEIHLIKHLNFYTVYEQSIESMLYLGSLLCTLPYHTFHIRSQLLIRRHCALHIAVLSV